VAAKKAKASAKKAAKAPAKKAAAKPKAKAAEPKPAKKAAQPRTPVHKEKVVIAHDVYEPNKDAIKAPLKRYELTWSYLGEDAVGKRGLYKKDGVNVFAHFKDDGVHYDVWGSDQKTVDAILRAWRDLLGTKIMAAAKEAGVEAAAQEQAQQESEALKLWRLQEPQRRPGEPDFFFDKRRAEWDAKKPT
jgi:hypothetical protein